MSRGAAHHDSRQAAGQRLIEKPRTPVSIIQCLNGWLDFDDDERLWGRSVWQWFEKRLVDRGKDLSTIPTSTGGIRLTCAYLMLVLEDKKFEDSDLRLRAGVEKDVWLQWRNGELSELAKALRREVERDRVDQSIPEIRRELVKKVQDGKEGSLKSSELLLKMGGRANGEPPSDTGVRVTVVQRYLPQKGEAIPQTASILLKGGSIAPTEIEKKVLSTGTKGEPNESGPIRGGGPNPLG